MSTSALELRQQISEQDFISVQRNVTNGGRSLNAIWKNPHLTIYEKAFLNVLGNDCDFTGDFLDMVIVTRWQIAERCSMSEETVKRTARSLQEKGYVIKIERKNEVNEDLANGYQLAPQLFDDHALYLAAIKVRQARGGLTDPRGGSHRPSSSPPLSLPEIPTTTKRACDPVKPAEGTFRPTVGPEEWKDPIAKIVREAKHEHLTIQANDLTRSIGLAVQNLGMPFADVLKVWPLCLMYLLEKRTDTPSSQVYKWLEVEQKRQKNAERIARSQDKANATFTEKWKGVKKEPAKRYDTEEVKMTTLNGKEYVLNSDEYWAAVDAHEKGG